MGGIPVIKHPFTGLRLAAATAAVVGLLAVSVGPVAADTTPGGDASYSQNGSTAELYASSCTDNGNDTVSCIEQQIGIFSGKMTDNVSGVTHASQVCAAVSTYTVDLTTGGYLGEPIFERGCAVDLGTGVIRFGGTRRDARDARAVDLRQVRLRPGCHARRGRRGNLERVWPDPEREVPVERE
jgi:hypothetical protein